jgi:hypothetical protein
MHPSWEAWIRPAVQVRASVDLSAAIRSLFGPIAVGVAPAGDGAAKEPGRPSTGSGSLPIHFGPSEQFTAPLEIDPKTKSRSVFADPHTRGKPCRIFGHPGSATPGRPSFSQQANCRSVDTRTGSPRLILRGPLANSRLDGNDSSRRIRGGCGKVRDARRI